MLWFLISSIADPKQQNDKIQEFLPDDLLLDMLYHRVIVRDTTTVYQILKDYFFLKVASYVHHSSVNQITHGILENFYCEEYKTYEESRLLQLAKSRQ